MIENCMPVKVSLLEWFGFDVLFEAALGNYCIQSNNQNDRSNLISKGNSPERRLKEGLDGQRAPGGSRWDLKAAGRSLGPS